MIDNTADYRSKRMKINSKLLMSMHTNTMRKKTEDNTNTDLSLPVHIGLL